MAKKSVIARNNKRKRMAIDKGSLVAIKRKKLIEERKKIRVELKFSAEKDNSSYVRQAMLLQFKLSRLKRDSSKVRYRRRCNIDGRPRGVYRDFGISRVRIRDFAGNCLLPGVVKC